MAGMPETQPIPPAERAEIALRNKVISQIIVMAGLMLLTVGAFFASRMVFKPYQPEVVGAASLKIDRESINLGDVKMGVAVQVVFKIQNTGDQPLVFTRNPFVEVLEGC
jgi:hypothetical protein